MGKGKRARAASNAARHPNTTAKQMIRERNQIADSIVKGLRIAQQDVSKVMTNVTHLLAVGMTKSEVVRAMNTDPLVIASRGREVAYREKLARMAALRRANKERTARSNPHHLLKKSKGKQTVTAKLDPWVVARTASGAEATKPLTFGTVQDLGERVTPRQVEGFNQRKLGGTDTPAVAIRTYDLPIAKPKAATQTGKLSGIEAAMKRIPAAQRHQFALFVHKHLASGMTVQQMAKQFLGKPLAEPLKTRPAANETVTVPQVVNAPVEVSAPEVVDMAVPVALLMKDITSPELRDGRELKGGSSERVVMQRDAAIQAEFRVLVRQNFGGRCAVSGKHLGGLLEAAHIEGADLGCYSVGNGILLSPTLHKLFDRHLMGVNPETLTVHFKPGIEFEEYEGRVIIPLIYNLDKARLAVRWAEYLSGTK